MVFLPPPGCFPLKPLFPGLPILRFLNSLISSFIPRETGKTFLLREQLGRLLSQAFCFCLLQSHCDSSIRSESCCEDPKVPALFEFYTCSAARVASMAFECTLCLFFMNISCTPFRSSEIIEVRRETIKGPHKSPTNLFSLEDPGFGESRFRI